MRRALVAVGTIAVLYRAFKWLDRKYDMGTGSLMMVDEAHYSLGPPINERLCDCPRGWLGGGSKVTSHTQDCAART